MAMTKETRKQYLQCLLMGRPLLHRSKQDEIESLRSQLAEAQAKLQEAQRDAARYRWLRDIASYTTRTWIARQTISSMDAAIDQAMREGE